MNAIKSKRFLSKHTSAGSFASFSSLLGKWSGEYIEHIVIRETVKLMNLRCLDLGYIPYN